MHAVVGAADTRLNGLASGIALTPVWSEESWKLGPFVPRMVGVLGTEKTGPVAVRFRFRCCWRKSICGKRRKTCNAIALALTRKRRKTCNAIGLALTYACMYRHDLT